MTQKESRQTIHLDRQYTNGINKHIKNIVKIIKNPESDFGEFDDEF
nr:hypothetical protein [Bacillus thuringiensis]